MTIAVLRASDLFVQAAQTPTESRPAPRPAPPSLSEDEFTRFYEEHARPLWGYICRMTSDPALADDLTQKAFVRFLASTLESVEEAILKGFLYRIATNLVYDHWRSGRRERAAFHGYIPEHTPSSDVLSHDLDRILEKLEPRERSLVWLAHVEEMTHREIAGILGVREASVKVMLFRARKRLAGLLENEGFQGSTS